MAQTGFTPIQLYSSSITGNTPAAADLLNSSGGSELAINIFDGKLFYKDSSGNVQVIGWKVVPVSAGGTGQTSYTDGQLLIGNSTGNTLTKATLTAGSGVTITNGAGAITINATGTGGTVTSVAALTLGTAGTDLSSTVANGTTTPVITLNVPTASATNRGALSAADWTTFNNKGSGSVTSVAASVPSFLSISGSPITTSGTLAITLSGTALPTTSGGTGLTSFTSGGVVYASSTSALATGTGLYFDGTNKVGIGTNSPDTSYGANLTVSSGNDVSSITIQSAYQYINNAPLKLSFKNTYTGGSELCAIYGYLAGGYNSGAMIFNTTSSGTSNEVMRLFPSKGVSIGNTTDPGAGVLFVASGVRFPATQVASADANTLDDYEEGTWSPAVTSGFTTPGYGTRAGVYTKIGNVVTFSIFLEVTSGTRAAAVLAISLPITSKNATGFSGSASWAYATGGVVGSTTTNLPTLYVNSNSTNLLFYDSSGNNFNGTNLAAATPGFYISGSYFTA